jgi:hypothetical protein
VLQIRVNDPKRQCASSVVGPRIRLQLRISNTIATARRRYCFSGAESKIFTIGQASILVKSIFQEI